MSSDNVFFFEVYFFDVEYFKLEITIFSLTTLKNSKPFFIYTKYGNCVYPGIRYLLTL